MIKLDRSSHIEPKPNQTKAKPIFNTERYFSYFIPQNAAHFILLEHEETLLLIQQLHVHGKSESVLIAATAKCKRVIQLKNQPNAFVEGRPNNVKNFVEITIMI